jgi:putative flippase GtrA
MSIQTRRLFTEISGYALVSAAALAVDTCILYTLVQRMGWDYIPASAVAFTTGATIAYLLSVRFVFPVRKLHNPYLEFVSFLTLGLAGVLVNVVALRLAIGAAGLGLITAKMVAACCTFATNFTLRRQVLFPPPKA